MMKKLTLAFLASISLATTNAQHQFQFGLKAGANLSNFNGSAYLNKEALVGFNGGLFTILPISKTLGIQPEVVYSGQGNKFNVGFPSAQHVNYFNIPVLLKYQHFTGFFLETGPQVGFVLSARFKTPNVDADNKSNFNSTDFSWAFGIGYKIPKTHLSIDARYNLGISNALPHVEDNIQNTRNIHNSVFQFGLMYALFTTGRK